MLTCHRLSCDSAEALPTEDMCNLISKMVQALLIFPHVRKLGHSVRISTLSALSSSVTLALLPTQVANPVEH
jgi:hypothetical protein